MIEKIIQHYKKYPVTLFFITACILVYCVSVLLFGFEMSIEDAISFGGYNPLFVDFYHQYYRLLTSQFIHFGLFHLAVNCYSLYGLGQFIIINLPIQVDSMI